MSDIWCPCDWPLPCGDKVAIPGKDGYYCKSKFPCPQGDAAADKILGPVIPVGKIVAIQMENGHIVVTETIDGPVEPGKGYRIKWR